MFKFKTLYRITIFFACLALLNACAAPQAAKVKQRYFWPPLPSEPKIEWVGSYSNDLDLGNDKSSFLSSFIGADSAQTSLDSPFQVASDGEGRLLISDLVLMSLIVFDFNKKNVYGLGGKDADITKPYGVGFDADGLAYASDSGNRKVYVFDKNNKCVKVFDLSMQLKTVGTITIDKKRRRLIVLDSKACQVWVFDLDGKHLFSFGKKGDKDGMFNNPLATAVDSAGNIHVADSFNARVQIFTPEGKFIRKFGERSANIGGFDLIKGIAIDSEDHIYVTDGKQNRFSIFDKEGELLLTVGSTYALRTEGKMAMGGFFLPMGIHIDQNDRIYVADYMNHRVQVFQYLNSRYILANPVKEGTKQAD